MKAFLSDSDTDWQHIDTLYGILFPVASALQR
jgi:hypothetical protein